MTPARKTPARKAAPTTAAAPAVDDSFDLASIFATEPQGPVPIKLLGVMGEVRRDYTGEEVILFSVLSQTLTTPGNAEALLSLITDVGPELWAKISPMAPIQAAQLLNKITELSGLAEGKLFRPLLDSELGPAGARPTQDSAATTS